VGQADQARLEAGFPSSLFTNTLLIGATAFPSWSSLRSRTTLVTWRDDENPITLSCKSISSTRIFKEHTKENRVAIGILAVLRFGLWEGIQMALRLTSGALRQWPAEMSTGPARPSDARAKRSPLFSHCTGLSTTSGC